MSAAASGGGCASAAPVPAAAATPIVTNGKAIDIYKQHVGRSSKATEDKMADFSRGMREVVPLLKIRGKVVKGGKAAGALSAEAW
eukprot:gene11299-16808_t